MSKSRVIGLITSDVVGERMAGPGIRNWEFAQALSKTFAVKLIVPPVISMETTPKTSEQFTTHVCTTVNEFKTLVDDCDVIVTLGLTLLFYPFLSKLDRPLVLDIYNPFVLEDLEQRLTGRWPERLSSYEDLLESLRIQLRAGDYFLCASSKQRDYWLGMLSALDRINPYTYQADPTLHSLIDVVPFGLPRVEPVHTHQVLKGVYDGIGPDDKVILWGGGIWNWLDANTAIKAMALIVEQRTDVKLFFMGINRPNLRMDAVDNAIALSEELGLRDKFVFFNDWVNYDERQNYLLEADLSVSLHLDHVETRFSFRTRLLDCMWTGLPTVATAGDALGEELAAHGLAFLVPAQDQQAVATTILELLDNQSLRDELAPKFEALAERYRWDTVVQPLMRFCEQPYLAPDKAYVAGRAPRRKRRGPIHLMQRTARVLQMEGFSGFWEQFKAYAQWRLQKIRKV